MKNFLIVSVALLSMTFASCKKCGHCEYKASTYGGAYNGSTTCKTSSTGTKLAYKIEKDACESSGDTWVTD